MKRILIVGMYNPLTRTLIERFSREGLEVFTLTGAPRNERKPRKVFEQYEFAYTSVSVPEVLASVKPEYVVFSGAYDGNFTWNSPRRDMVDYLSGLLNILTSCMEAGVQRFLYLSSEEVFGEGYVSDIPDDTRPSPASEKALAIYQGEKLCLNLIENLPMRMLVLRLDHVYGLPGAKGEIDERIAELCLAGVERRWVEIQTRHAFSGLFADDAAEAVFRILSAASPKQDIYHFSSGRETDEGEIAELVRQSLAGEAEVVEKPLGPERRLVLSNQAFCEEFRVSIHHQYEETVPRICEAIQKRQKKFSARKRRFGKGSRLLRAAIPLLENLLVFVLAIVLAGASADSQFFQKLDFYLLYVLLFAGLYGKKHAILSAFLSSAGYILQRAAAMSGPAVLIDYNTYIWIAQLFIVGMVVGYIRDRVQSVNSEKQEQEEYLENQVQDILKVNQSNMRLKNVMEQRLISYDGSLGQLYEITEQLDHVAVGEVLFYAADIVSRVMDTRDVAIYRVDRSGYGRLMAAISGTAKSLGKSIRIDKEDYRPLMECFAENRVYINKDMRQGLPMMASALQGDGRIRFVIMLWGLGFESMTLHQADILTVLSYMIYHAADRSEQYWQALEDQRSVPGTHILNEESFRELVDGSRNANEKGLTEFTVLKIPRKGRPLTEWDERLRGKVRETDYAGVSEDGNLCILLTNSTRADARFVVERMERAEIEVQIDEASS